MKIPTKKLKSGFEMPVFGLGTWQMGGRYSRDPDNDDETDVKAIKTAIDLGITHIDTAESYAAGHAEELVGQAIKGYDRSKLLLVSKVWPTHLAYRDVTNSAKASLKRLQTEYLDLYLIHGPNPEIPIEETMEAMDELIREDLIKNIGVSNFNVNRIEEAQSRSKYKIVANQLHYNLMIREVEKKGLLKYSQGNAMMLIAWRPIQKGILTEGNPLVDELCRKYGKTPGQIAINWLISQDNVVTLSKTSNIDHLKENLGAVGWIMDKEDVELLRKEYPGQQTVSGTYPLD